jgi:hypothetical protein
MKSERRLPGRPTPGDVVVEEPTSSCGVPRDPWSPISAETWQRLRESWPNGERLTLAWRLARDVDTLGDLLLGLPVDPDRIDRVELARARTRRLVRLDLSPADLLEARA